MVIYLKTLFSICYKPLEQLGEKYFKSRLKHELKPPKIKHFAKGSKYGNTLLTRIRLQRSELNLHRFSIGQSDSAECICQAKRESPRHYLLDCLNYTAERQSLFDQVEHFIPTSKNLTKSKK